MTKVLRFPPLPPIPDPPSLGPDDRQATFSQIVAGLASGLTSAEGSFAAANVFRGFRASAVDLGTLQEVLSTGLAPFDMAQVRERWNEDLFDWMRRVVMTWIQRCKETRFDLESNGVRISLVTQDDRGYYRYELDVFPGIRTDSPLPAP